MSPRRPDLEASIRGFAHEISDLLNSTVSNGVRLSSVTDWAPTYERLTGYVGYRLSGGTLTPDHRLEVGAAFVAISFELDLEVEGFLLARRSRIAVYASREAREPWFRYEYVRDAKDYPEAHLQIHGHCPALDELNNQRSPTRSLHRLHFPVGGKRFRPILEDVIQFLIEEGYADGRLGWREALEESRHRYYLNQLKAAVRREPEAAWEALSQTEWWRDRQ